MEDGNLYICKFENKVILYVYVELVKLSHCPKHQARPMKKSQKTLVTNPILSNEVGARGQADLILIDMRTNPDGEFTVY